MKSTVTRALVQLIGAFYGLGLWLYPPDFRREFGEQISDHVRSVLEASRVRDGLVGVLRECRRLGADQITSLVREWQGFGGDSRDDDRTSPRQQRSRWGGRGDGMFRTIGNDVRIATRSLRRSPAFTIVVVSTLAMGIGANVAMFDAISGAFLRPLPFVDADRLVVGQTTFGGNLNPSGSSPDFYDFRDRARSFERVSLMMPFPLSQPVTGGDIPEMVVSQIVSWDYLRMLGLAPLIARDFNADEGEDGAPAVLLVSHGYWQTRLGGDPEVIGRTMTVDGTATTVVGVMPAGRHLIVDADLWLPLQPNGPFAGVRRFHNWLTVGRLKEDVSIAEAQAEARLIYRQLEDAYPDSNADKGLRITPLREMLISGSRQAMLLLWGAIGLVLLIACGNVAGLLLARGSSRTTELSVRSALGASRGRLVRYLLTESLLLAACGGVAGLALGAMLRVAIARVVPVDLPGAADPGMSIEVIAFALLLTVGTGLLFGLLPAIRGARANVAADLKSGRRASGEGGSARLRSAMVVTQVALSVVLLVGSGLLVRSFARITGVDPGFQPGNLLTSEIRLPGNSYPDRQDRAQFFTSLLESVQALPGVASAAAVSRLPIANPGNNVMAWAAERPPVNPGDAPIVYQRNVLPGYFRTMGIPLRSGRPIEATDDMDAPQIMVINEALARRIFPGEVALGRVVSVDVGADDPEPYEVVGVTGDVRISALNDEAHPAMYFSYRQRGPSLMRLAIRTYGDPEAVAPAVRAAVAELDPDIPLAAVATMEDLLARSVSSYRLMAVALSLFGGIALFLSALGLYGILAYYVGRRVHEIGVRVALGANAAGVVGMVFRRGLTLVALGLTVGLVAAVLSTGILRTLLFAVEPTDPATFITVALFFFVIAALASFVPGLRAARIDPAVAFRAE